MSRNEEESHQEESRHVNCQRRRQVFKKKKKSTKYANTFMGWRITIQLFVRGYSLDTFGIATSRSTFWKYETSVCPPSRERDVLLQEQKHQSSSRLLYISAECQTSQTNKKKKTICDFVTRRWCTFQVSLKHDKGSASFALVKKR